MSSSNSTLTDLLASTPHRLAFSLPLFFVSLLLTFAGTFLTLDRTRSFPSSYAAIPMPGSLDPQKKRSKFKYVLEGGIGGLAIGYVFGVQLSTFFTLLVPNVSPSAPLSPNAFLAVWILSCVVTTLIGGRYRYCARLFTGICGGALTALALSVIIHPSLLTRQVLVALFAILYPIVVFLCYIPRLHRFLHATFRFSASSAGAFCFILSIAALSKTPAWVNVWERLWLHDGTTWGTSKERGMSAAFCILTCFGVVSDWAFNRWLGECPDEKWDNYLAKYAANLPSDSSRAGTFTPLPSRSLWNRLFGPSGTDEALPPLQPPFGRSTSMGSITKDPLELESLDGFSKSLSYDDPPATGVLRKKSQAPSARFIAPKRSQTKRIRGRRRPIKFGADLSSESEDESSANEADTRVRPWLLQKFSTSSSTPTLVDEPMRTEAGDLKKPRILTVGPDGVDISDYEEDITTPRSAIPGTKRGEPGWVPAFIRQSTSSSGTKDHGGDKQQTNGLPLPVMAPVPTTPSLIQAFNRIAAAQQDAFNSHSPLSQSINTEVGNIVPRHDGLPNTQNVGDVKDFNKEEDVVSRTQRAREWDHFWKEVARKASS